MELTFENGFSGNVSSQILYTDRAGGSTRVGETEQIGFVVSSKSAERGDFVLGDINNDGEIGM